mgnify:CR=1 FL=1
MNIDQMRQRFAKVTDEARDRAAKIGPRIGGWYDRNGHWVRLGANVGVYAGGCAVLAKSAVGVVGGIGIALVTAGAIGSAMSGIECLSKSGALPDKDAMIA